jgi:hypothetical protein
MGYRATEHWSSEGRTVAIRVLVGWMIMTKFLKLLGHFFRYPSDFLWLPASIGFGYLHGFIKLYAMCTLNVVSLRGLQARRRCDANRSFTDCLGK